MVCAVEALAGLVIGKTLQEIVSDFRGFYRLLTSDSQMRWVRTCSEVEKNLPSADVMGDCLRCCLHQLGPEKGVIHLATAAVLNAVWDLWARAQGKVGQALLEHISFKHLHDSWHHFPAATVEAARRHGESLQIWMLDLCPGVITSDVSVSHVCQPGSQADCLMH